MRYGFQLVHDFDKSILPTSNAVAELKYDGTMVLWDGKENKIWNRHGHDVTVRFPLLHNYLSANFKSYVLVGEVCVFDKNGISDFNEILHRGENPVMNRLRDKVAPAKMIVFDILERDGKDLTAVLQQERFGMLPSNIPIHNVTNGVLVTRPRTWDISELEYAQQFVRDNNEEGLVIKRNDRPYKITVGDKRTDNWIKWKAWLYKGMEVIRSGPTGDGHGFTAFISNNGREQEVAVQRVSDQEKLTKGICKAIVVRYLEESAEGALRQPTCKGVHGSLESALKAAKWDA
jgi:ATP-dependent DNA ligase